MGSLLLMAGEKDLRFALPNARIMVHQPSGGFQGKATDIERHAQDIINQKAPERDLRQAHRPAGREGRGALDRDNFMTAEEAKDFGLIDKVIDKRPEEAAAKP